MKLSDVFDSSRLATGGMIDFAAGLIQPTIRLGVTGLSRSGKTIFITALINALTNGAKLPMFEAYAQGRVSKSYLEPQPDDDVPRFAAEQHMADLTADDRHWPEGTTRISQLRLTMDYQPQGLFARNFGSGKLHIDIIDYPGEWLLDLPLMNLSYQQWSASTVAVSRNEPRKSNGKDWHAHLLTLRPTETAHEPDAVKAAGLFTAYLARCRSDDVSLSTLPPGRFLMPGDLQGSPLLTFAPLDIAADAVFEPGSLAALMAKRYDSYVKRVVKPFFFDHFARLDRQIVLVDVLSALNAGPAAVSDLRNALTQTMSCFRQGSNSIFSEIFGRRIDRVLFAATKADQLHHTSHDRLEAIMRLLVDEASAKLQSAGADYDVTAIAAIRATREATVKQKGEELLCIVGTPKAGEIIGETIFDGSKEAAIFPGDLPLSPTEAISGSNAGLLKFIRFRPPLRDGKNFAHIRLDRALEYLLGDRFK